jgi:maltoporin
MTVENWKYRISLSILAISLGMGCSTTGHADELADLRQQMQALEARMEQLAAKENAKSETEKREKDFKDFEFHGYSRAGFGWNQDGGTGNRYRWNYDASGMDEHYWRLGNESHNAYTNLTFVYNYDTGGTSFAKFVSSLIFEPKGEDNWEPTSTVLRQLYAEMGNFDWAPGVTFWAGEKWYRHPGDQHITDWQFLDIAGYGGGVGDISLGGFGKLSLAALGFIDENDYMTDNGEPASYVVDIRVEDIPVGPMNMLLQFAETWTTGGDLTTPAANGETRLDSESGWMSAMYLTYPEKVMGVLNNARLIARYGHGYGSTLFNTRYMVPNPVATNVDWSESSRWSLCLDGLMEFSDNLQFMPVVAYQHFDNGLEDNNKIDKFLYGGRMKYSITENIALQLEAGAIYLDSEPSATANGHLDDTLYKFTFAPTIQPKLGFFARPEIRFFVTYAFWDDEESTHYLEDNAGLDPDDTSGLTYGIQFEAWW